MAKYYVLFTVFPAFYIFQGNTAGPLYVSYAVRFFVRLPKFSAGLQAKFTSLYATSREIWVI